MLNIPQGLGQPPPSQRIVMSAGQSGKPSSNETIWSCYKASTWAHWGICEEEEVNGTTTGSLSVRGSRVTEKVSRAQVRT